MTAAEQHAVRALLAGLAERFASMTDAEMLAFVRASNEWDVRGGRKSRGGPRRALLRQMRLEEIEALEADPA